jgi:hypothetical protein
MAKLRKADETRLATLRRIAGRYRRWKLIDDAWRAKSGSWAYHPDDMERQRLASAEAHAEIQAIFAKYMVAPR